SHAVPAQVAVQLRARWLEPGVPVLAGGSIPYVYIPSRPVHGYAVVAVPGYPPVLGILVDAVASACLRGDPPILAAPDIVDPRCRCIGPGNYVLICGFVKIAVLHGCLALPRFDHLKRDMVQVNYISELKNIKC